MQKLRGQTLADAITLAREGQVGKDRQKSAKAIPTKTEFFDPKMTYLDLLGLPVVGLPQAIERAALLKSLRTQKRLMDEPGGGISSWVPITLRGALGRARGSTRSTPVNLLPKGFTDKFHGIMEDVAKITPQKDLDKFEDVLYRIDPRFKGEFTTPKNYPSLHSHKDKNIITLNPEPFQGNTGYDLRKSILDTFFHETGHAKFARPDPDKLAPAQELIHRLDKALRKGEAWKTRGASYGEVPEELLTYRYGARMRGALPGVPIPAKLSDTMFKRSLGDAMYYMLADPKNLYRFKEKGRAKLADALYQIASDPEVGWKKP